MGKKTSISNPKSFFAEWIPQEAAIDIKGR